MQSPELEEAEVLEEAAVPRFLQRHFRKAEVAESGQENGRRTGTAWVQSSRPTATTMS